MSNQFHGRRSRTDLPDVAAIKAKLEAEMAEGYLEVAPEGISFRQLLFVYASMIREGRDRTLGSLRALFRFHPAH